MKYKRCLFFFVLGLILTPVLAWAYSSCGWQNRPYLGGLRLSCDKETPPISNTYRDTVPPTVSISSPSNGSIVSSNVSITASASDNVGISRVEFYVNGVLHLKDTSAPYSYSWNTANAGNTTHTAKVRAYDVAGNVSDNQISLVVNNQVQTQRQLSVSLVGSPELVFDYSAAKCETLDIPDLYARAFRSGDGRVHLVASHWTTREMVGATLNNVARRCAPVMRSHEDRDQMNYNFHEWLAAPYTLDGNTVYALLHDEWYAYLADSRCGSADPSLGWISAVTSAVSRDGGASYTHPTDYLVRYSTTPWSTSFPCDSTNYTRYGYFTPSNIVKNDADGYYYSLVHRVTERPNINRGACVIRTSDLGNASSWEVLTDGGWARSKTAECKMLANLSTMHGSLTYNTYLGLFVVVDQRYGAGDPRQGVYFSTSKNLIDWSPAQLIVLGSDLQYQYPSFLDPSDTSRNFERPGQSPYMYFIRHNGGLDRDLLRQKIQFVLQ